MVKMVNGVLKVHGHQFHKLNDCFYFTNATLERKFCPQSLKVKVTGMCS